MKFAAIGVNIVALHNVTRIEPSSGIKGMSFIYFTDGSSIGVNLTVVEIAEIIREEMEEWSQNIKQSKELA